MDEKELCQDPTPGHSSQSVTSTLRWEVGGGGGGEGRGVYRRPNTSVWADRAKATHGTVSCSGADR